MKKFQQIQKKAFTMIEVIIWVFIFSLGLVWVFMLFWESSKLAIKSKKIIIATWLARESVELVKNIRDSNYKKNIRFNWIPNFTSGSNKSDKYKWVNNYFTWWTSASWAYYKIENIIFDKDNNNYLPIKVEKIDPFKLEDFRLCLKNNKYYYCEDTSWEIKTDFYKYINFKEAKYSSWSSEENIPNSFKVTSIVKRKKWWWWKVEIPFILADWKR